MRPFPDATTSPARGGSSGPTEKMALLGEQDIKDTSDSESYRDFVKALLEDVRALEIMLEKGLLESETPRIGAEQEIFLVDPTMGPEDAALRVLDRLEDPRFTTELGLFNLEANLTPRELGGDCLSRMEAELTTLLEKARVAAAAEDCRVLLVGILPTLDKAHLGLSSMTPLPRYRELGRVMRELRGGQFRTYIKGLDELDTTHDNVMLEACNTSFQIHFQVNPADFARFYNLAQVVTSPVLAAAVNSPLFLRRRLWHETRVALFQQAVDTRSETHTQRGGQSRVSFGERWVKESVLEIFRDDIARFRVLMARDVEESPLSLLERGETPALRALSLHNGTVYRWNRPCYGVKDGRAHLRIENRTLPAGPSILDEIANAALFFGLMCGLSDEHRDVTRLISFDDAKSNFLAAARYGLQARMRWLDGAVYGADELLLKELLPRARAGLAARGIESTDLDRYFSVIEARVRSGRTGAQWVLHSLASIGDRATVDERDRSLTAAILRNQETEKPVHTWEPARLPADAKGMRESYRTVGQVMQTDLFTVGPEDLVDLAASLMDWEHIRHVPVENHNGYLVGLVTHRQLLRMLAQGYPQSKSLAVREIMAPDPITVTPQTGIRTTIRKMREHRVGCLPVVEEGKLVGIVTERDFIDLAARLLDRYLDDETAV